MRFGELFACMGPGSVYCVCMEKQPTPSAPTSQLQADWFARLQMARAIAAYKEVVRSL